jgi:hypothetical protein
VPIHKPHEKRYAETEIVVNPYPPRKGVPTQVGSVVHNGGTVPATVKLSFGWAHFGLGIPFTTTNMVPSSVTINLAPGTTLTPTVTWTPVLAGPQCIQVILEDADGEYRPQRSQRNVNVIERPPCGVTRVYSFTVHNDSNFTRTVDIGMMTFNVPEDWQVTVDPSGSVDLGPHEDKTFTVTVLIPCATSVQQMQAQALIEELQEAAGSIPTIDVEGYIKGELVGGIELQFIPEEPEDEWMLSLPLIMRDRP